MFIYYKYAQDGTRKNIYLTFVDDCVYWYASEDLGKWFVDNLGEIFHVNFLWYAHWFMSIRIAQIKNHSISVYQDRYNTSIVAKYLDTVIFKASTIFYKTNFPSDIIFSEANASISDEQVEMLTGGFNIHHRACIGSIIYLLSTRVKKRFIVHKLETF